MKLVLVAGLLVVFAFFAFAPLLGVDVSLGNILDLLTNAIKGMVDFFAKLLEGLPP